MKYSNHSFVLLLDVSHICTQCKISLIKMVLPLFSYPDKLPKNYFVLQRVVLKTLGISFTGNESFFYRIYSILWLTSVVLSFSIVEFYEIYVYMDDMDALVNNLSYLGTDLLGEY